MKLEQPYHDRMLAWVLALESGEYDQTTGVLERHDDSPDGPASYCCLGVLAKQIREASDAPAHEAKIVNFLGGNWSGFAMTLSTASSTLVSGVLPEEFKRWAVGLKAAFYFPANALIEMNDDERRDFDEIAAYLRDFYELGPRQDQVLTADG